MVSEMSSSGGEHPLLLQATGVVYGDHLQLLALLACRESAGGCLKLINAFENHAQTVLSNSA